MPITLTQEQVDAMVRAAEPLQLVDPTTNEAYVLVPAEQYQRLKTVLQDEFDPREAYPLMDAIAAKEGWEDPALDIYSDLDPRRNG